MHGSPSSEKIWAKWQKEESVESVRGSYELSSVGRKMLGGLHAKLGKILKALDGR